ncbi:MAG: aspartyl/asparaginyl beta-hydroxylase domain-containing protein, partial [Brevundimonas sp.]|nr:aspartyl/asparaginyl beta-hydroxylase domain-containing protein [Brevundimonas sp.]
MKLEAPFIKLPFRFDVSRLQEEIAAFPAEAWVRHPNNLDGNSALRLITVGGGENDDVAGAMAMTPHLKASPYLQQVLAHFGVVWSRSRLMKLGPGASVPMHTDINYHWYHRVRLHIPIVTTPDVKFFCGDQVVHMAEGDSWIFDNWRTHKVENGSDIERVHLVADTPGNGRFWDMAWAAATQDV